MIPEFDDNGYLPPGIHPATIEEIDERFGRESETRQSEMQSLRWLIELAKKVGTVRIVINGSFVTEEWEPNDVDCTLLLADDYPRDEEAAKHLTRGLPFVHLELARQQDFDFMVNRVYATDRLLRSKGVVEIIQWT